MLKQLKHSNLSEAKGNMCVNEEWTADPWLKHLPGIQQVFDNVRRTSAQPLSTLVLHRIVWPVELVAVQQQAYLQVTLTAQCIQNICNLCNDIYTREQIQQR